MSECLYLKGENIAPRTNKQAKKLIGMRVQYLLARDIDKSGRGYFFPRYGTVTDVSGRSIDMNNSRSWDVYISDLREMVIAK